MLTKITSSIKNNIWIRNIILAVSVIVLLMIGINYILKMVTRHGEKNKVPNFSGMTMAEASRAAAELKLEMEIIDSLYVPSQKKGVILEQYPKPGNFVKSGRHIFLTTNTFQPKVVPLPYVAGFSLRQAKNKLVGSGFVIDRLIYVDDIATNNVLKQSYNDKQVTAHSNIFAEIGSGVTLTVGNNPVDEMPMVPSLIGATVAEAKNRIWEAGFNIGSIDIDDNINYENMDQARVYEQHPNRSFRAVYGRGVSIKLTLDDKRIEEGRKSSNREAAKLEKIYQDSLANIEATEKESAESSEDEIDQFFNNIN